jgi:hypothetical protein
MSITSITIPDSVTNIGGDSFIGCDSLTTITFKNRTSTSGITLETNWHGGYTWTEGVVGSDYVFSR